MQNPLDVFGFQDRVFTPVFRSDVDLTLIGPDVGVRSVAGRKSPRLLLSPMLFINSFVPGFLCWLVWLSAPSVRPVLAAAAMQASTNNPAFLNFYLPTGVVDHDAKCDVRVVEEANAAQLHFILEQLVNLSYFRLFRVDLKKECPYWRKEGEPPKESQCESVHPDEEPRCPLEFEEEEGPFGRTRLREREPLTSAVDMTISSREDEVLDAKVDPCDDVRMPTFWLNMCSKIGVSEDSEYVNLRRNEEGNTGYNGSHVWLAIYEENCFSIGSKDDVCYEERVLYRLLSGMHSSTNIHVAMRYRPVFRNGESSWLPNATHFVNQFQGHPEYIKNLHFAFLVLLRALNKAAPFLYHHKFSTDPTEELQTSRLVRRLLDSDVLHACHELFDAFDESLLFKSKFNDMTLSESPASLLKRQFKGVFQNISTVLDCVSCQKCKLHAKLQLLGMGTALKVLLLPDHLIHTSLDRDEISALFNTLYALSSAIKAVPVLTQLYQQEYNARAREPFTQDPSPPAPTDNARTRSASSGLLSFAEDDSRSESEVLGAQGTQTDPIALMDTAVGTIARAANDQLINAQQEDALIDAAIGRRPELLLLAKHYSPARFLRHAIRNLQALTTPLHNNPTSGAVVNPSGELIYDAVIIGGGLAGAVAALSLLDRGARVVLMEKEGHMGGNSAWASSGLNAVGDTIKADPKDSWEVFLKDIQKTGGPAVVPELATVLAGQSEKGLDWLRTRVKLPLPLVSQLGGHSFARTYRPEEGMAGSVLMFALEKLLKSYTKPAQAGLPPPLTFRFKTRATKILQDKSGAVLGVGYEHHEGATESEQAAPLNASRQNVSTQHGTLRARNVVLTTGGYGRDSAGLLKQHRPDLATYPTTNGRWATGDGIYLATALGAQTRNLDSVQVHPTSFVDPKHPDAHRKVLCAELLRGVGGVLLDQAGRRFVNELAPRDVVTQRMQEQAQQHGQSLEFFLLLNDKAADEAPKHVPHYVRKGLMTHFDSLEAAAHWMAVPAQTLHSVMSTYDKAAAGTEEDAFGKQNFPNAPLAQGGGYVVGRVTPAIHYCQGGVSIDSLGRVLRVAMASGADGSQRTRPIPGLYAAGEVTGGLHGKNRLAGNGLTEAVVFGRAIASAIDLAAPTGPPAPAAHSNSLPDKERRRVVEKAELAEHSTPDSCWIAVEKNIYDLTAFAPQHPGGPESVHAECGKDATVIYKDIHPLDFLDDFEVVGTLP
eukprot:g12992.t1